VDDEKNNILINLADRKPSICYHIIAEDVDAGIGGIIFRQKPIFKFAGKMFLANLIRILELQNI